MKKLNLAAALCASSMLLPAAGFAQTNQQQAGNDACDVLVNYLEEHQGYDFPVTLDEANRLDSQGNQEACRTGINEIDQAVRGNQVERTAEARQQDEQRAQQAEASGDAEGAEIVLRQTPPRILVDQASPDVTVQQPQPQVSVSQPTPEILVQQPAPTVTVDIPQPVITLRMPEPDVNVAMAQPQVQVDQAQPEVRIAEQGQPEIQVEQDQAEVMVQRQQQQARVQVEESAQPQVRYEREQANVRINQEEGEPQIRVERVAGAESGARTGDEPQTTGALTEQGQRQGVRVSNLLDADVTTREDEEVGTVERVLIDPDSGSTLIVVGLSGNLGEEGRTIAVDLDEVSMRGDTLVLTSMSDAQVEQAPEWTEGQMGNFQDAQAGQQAQVNTIAQ